MSKISWRTLRDMNESQLKDECEKLSLEIEGLSKYVGDIKNDDQHDEFLNDFSDCLDHLHGIRNAIEAMYFK